MKRAGKFFLFLALFLLLTKTTIANPGYESLFYKAFESRGMVLFFIGIPMLFILPLLNKPLKTLSVFIIVILISRGLMRISDEQDIVRTAASVVSGLKLGIPLAAAFLITNAMITAFWKILRKLKVSRSMEPQDIQEYISNGRKQGKTLEQLKKELVERNISEEKINEAIRRL